jgi:phosphate transport system permease protein
LIAEETHIINTPQKKESSFGKRIMKSTRIKENIIRYFFAVNGVMALVFIILIFVFLFKEGIQALEHIGLLDFIYFDQVQADGSVVRLYEWFPTSEEARFSLIPLIIGTLVTAVPATIISTIFGVAAGIYLSEISNPKFKEFLKPMIELFAGIPTVVLGFIMLVVGASFFNDLLNPDNRLYAFIAAIGL